MCRVLNYVHHLSSESWEDLKEKYPPEYNEAIEAHNLLSTFYPPIESGVLSELARERVRDPFIFINKPPFYLPPLWGDNKNFIPILYLTCDLREQPAEFQIRIGLICIDNVSTAPQPRIIGYRYEKESGNSRHNYYHTQLTLRPLEPEITLPLFSPDLPEQTPCIPVPARCIVSVFLCMLVSLYGSQYVIDIIRELDIATEIIRPLEMGIFGAPVRIHHRRRSART